MSDDLTSVSPIVNDVINSELSESSELIVDNVITNNVANNVANNVTNNVANNVIANNVVANNVVSNNNHVAVVDKDSFDIMNPNPKKLKIIMTVALPALKSKKIIWLALESLRLQEKVDFGWELIVWEEWAESKSIVKSFVRRLPNCLRVRYKSLPTQVSLIKKWMGIRDEASKTSEIYVLHAADDFSPSRRLWIHRQHFLRHSDCVLSAQYKVLFYNIMTGQKILYKIKEQRVNPNMAYRMSYMSRVKNTSANRGIDGHIWKCIRAGPENIRFSSSIDPENWMTGMCTDGYNNISLSRKNYYDNIAPPFYPYNKAKCWKHIPEHVKNFVKSLRNF